MRPWTTGFLAWGLLMLVALTMPPATADSTTVMNASLPGAAEGTSAVWDGHDVYVFGGRTLGATDRIVRYNITTDTATTMNARLPSSRYGTSAVWTGANAYVFGGSADGTQIVRYSPSTDTVTVMAATLPTARWDTSAVWDGQNAYVFGGSLAGGDSNEIVRYNPSSDTATVMTATLPSGREETSAVWSGTYAYIIGGYNTTNGDALNEIVRYRPSTSNVTVVSATLPSARYLTSAVWDGHRVYILGGYAGGVTGAIVGYDPTTDAVTAMNATLPTARRGMGAAWDNKNAYLLGGYDGNTYLTQIVRYSLEPGGPVNASASRGPGVGQLTLTWGAPDTNTYSAGPLTYRVYRSNTSGGAYQSVGTTSGLNYSDSGLPNNATRYYKVSASTAAGEGPLSAETNATTFGVPSSPRSLVVSAGPGSGRVALTWQAPASDGGRAVTNYTVYRGPTSGSETLLATIGNATSFNETGLPNGTTYSYRVSATNVVGEGSTTGSASNSTLPGPPLAPAAATGSGPRNLTVSWTPPDPNAAPVANYTIYRGNASGSEAFLARLGNVTSYGDTGLANGSAYYYRVTATNAGGEGPSSDEVSATTLPAAPVNVTATAGPGAGEITVTWAPPTGNGDVPVTGYSVYRGNTSGSEVFLASLDDVTDYRDSALPNNATRFYRVTATNAGGEGSRSAEASAATFALPGAPRNLTASAGAGAGQVAVAWQAPASNGGTAFTGYNIYRGPSNGTETLLTTIGNVTMFTDSGLPNGTTYSYRASASNVAGEGSLSNPSSNTTLPGPPLDVTTTTGPAQTISLSWNPPAPNAAALRNYTVYRGNASGAETLLVRLGNVTSYTDTNLPNGSVRYYKMTATNGGGEGAASSEVTGTTRPAAPRNLSVSTGPGAGNLSLTWLPPADNSNAPITGYEVYRGNSSGFEALLATLGNTTSYADTGLPNNSTRYYKVSAINAGGEGPRGAGANGTTFNVPSAPRNLSATRGPETGQITVAWQPPASTGGLAVEAFKVYRGASPGSETFLTQVGNVSTFTDTGLPDGTTFAYQVSAANGAGEGASSSEVNGTTPGLPSAPRNLTAAAGAGAGQITLSWVAPPDDGGQALSGYEIYRGTASDALSPLTTVGTQTAYTDGSLPAATTYYYSVSAFNIIGEGPTSGIASATTFRVPSAPGSVLTTRGPGAGQITVTWQPPSSNGGMAVTNYKIYRGTTHGQSVELAVVGNVLTYTDSSLPTGATRYYRVAAINPVGEGPLSAEVSGLSPTFPSSPRNLAASSGPAAGQISIAWLPPNDSGGITVLHYRVYRGVPGGPVAYVADAFGTNFTDTGQGEPTQRGEGAQRHYQVTAVNDVGEGGFSNDATGYTPRRPSAPEALRATSGPGLFDITLDWDSPLDDGGVSIAHYRIYKGASPGSEVLLDEIGPVREYTYHGKPLERAYFYVTAVNSAGLQGPASNEVCSVTYPGELVPPNPLYPGC